MQRTETARITSATRAGLAGLGISIAVVVAACDKAPAPAAPPAVPAAAASPNPAASAIVPHDGGTLPKTPGATGAAEGSTAIGGVVGGQDKGATKGGAPAPTGGDGAAPPAKAASQ
jgi:hypothetical protein